MTDEYMEIEDDPMLSHAMLIAILSAHGGAYTFGMKHAQTEAQTDSLGRLRRVQMEIDDVNERVTISLIKDE